MPRSSSKTLLDFGVPEESIRAAFDEIMRTKSQLNDLKSIFEIALKDLSLFPNINLVDGATYTD